MTDYRKFKSPFFEITVYDSSGSDTGRKVKLPHHIMRLVEKVEIMETLEAKLATTINLHFIEGSREPASPNANLGTKGLYKFPSGLGGSSVDMNVAGSITNRPGVITDLRFSGKSGITFSSAAEIATGSLDKEKFRNVKDEVTVRKFADEPKEAVLLFQEKNQIKVTWGYLEDRATQRSIRARISIVRVSFPESGHIRTTITCMSEKGVLKRLSPCTGKNTGKNKKDGISTTKEDNPINEVLRDICQALGMKGILSSETQIPYAREQKHAQKVIKAGQSLNRFIEEMAQKGNADYDVRLDPKTGESTLIFLNRTDLEKKVILPSGPMFTYKAPGSIIKSVNVIADFKGDSGYAAVGIDAESTGQKCELNKANSNQVTAFPISETNNTVGQTQNQIDDDPGSGTNPISSARLAPNFIGESVGKSELHPTVDDKGNKADAASVKDFQQRRKAINLTFTSLGFTQIIPGMLEIGGLGRRFSGKYRITTVTHTIDSSGYVCKVDALGDKIGQGGLKNTVAKKGEDVKQEEFQISNPITPLRFIDPVGTSGGSSFNPLAGIDASLGLSPANAFKEYKNFVLQR